MRAQQKILHAGVVIVEDIPKMFGLIGVTIRLFLRIDLCNYIRRIEEQDLFVSKINTGVYLGTIQSYME